MNYRIVVETERSGKKKVLCPKKGVMVFLGLFT